MDKPERIIILSTPKGLEAAFLQHLEMLQDVDVVMMSTAPPLGLLDDSLSVLKAKSSIQEVIRWHEDMEFVAQEEKSLQPTNPYFGKEKWKKKRKR